MSKTITLKIEQCSEQEYGPVRKIIGLLGPRSFNHLIDVADLSANPRSAKRGSVTADIEQSLKENPELFPAKTKGILFATANYKPLERQRYQLIFEDIETEGLLDGGHNALAIGRYILEQTGLGESELKRIRDWATFAEVWRQRRNDINDIEESLDFHVPIEIQVPVRMHDPNIVSEFKSSLLEIGSARNNNVQLSEETKANKQGLYEPLKRNLPVEIAESVEWKSNDGGRIKPRELVALCWIPLSLLELPDGIRVAPNQIYRNKGVCIDAYNKLLKHSSVSTTVEGGYDYEIVNESVKSALQIGASLPLIYDKLYTEFPNKYNASGGSFGKINSVRIYERDRNNTEDKNQKKYLKTPPKTPFTRVDVKYTCPDGFLVPFIYGMRALMMVKPGGIITWDYNPYDFIENKMLQAMKSYRLAIELGSWDPQQVGKKISAYDFAESAIRNSL